MNRPAGLHRDEVYRILGHEILIRSNSSSVLDHLRSVYGRFLVADDHDDDRGDDQGSEPGSNGAFTIEVDDEIDGSGRLLVRDAYHEFDLRCDDIHSFDYQFYESPGTVPDPLTHVQWLVLDSLARLASNRLLIHGGSLAWENDGMVLAGPSGRGKTTLTLALALRGFGVLSDEVACLDYDSDQVAWFPRRVNLSDHSRILLGLAPFDEDKQRTLGSEHSEWVLDLEDIAPARLVESSSLRYLIFLRGFGEAPRLEPISRTAGLFQLMKNTLAPVGDIGLAMARLATTLESTRCFQLVVGDLRETTDLLVELVAEHPEPAHGTGP